MEHLKLLTNCFTQETSEKLQSKKIKLVALFNFMSTDLVCMGENNGAGEVVNGDMLGAKSWMVRTQKKLEFEEGKRSEKAIKQKRGENIKLEDSDCHLVSLYAYISEMNRLTYSCLFRDLDLCSMLFNVDESYFCRVSGRHCRHQCIRRKTSHSACISCRVWSC